MDARLSVSDLAQTSRPNHPRRRAILILASSFLTTVCAGRHPTHSFRVPTSGGGISGCATDKSRIRHCVLPTPPSVFPFPPYDEANGGARRAVGQARRRKRSVSRQDAGPAAWRRAGFADSNDPRTATQLTKQCTPLSSRYSWHPPVPAVHAEFARARAMRARVARASWPCVVRVCLGGPLRTAEKVPRRCWIYTGLAR